MRRRHAECMVPTRNWRELLRSAFFMTLAVITFTLFARIYFAPFTDFKANQLSYTFDSPGILNEAGTASESSSPYWWLDSGGELHISGGIGSTMRGEASASDAWRARYAQGNPEDTDRGAHPQNLFRLISKSEWDNVRIEASFRIIADNFSSSPNRNESNGILLLSHYRDDGETLYYAGLRVDGHAIIKKKLNGVYTTLAEIPIYSGEYDRDAKVNLLPHNEWLTLGMETHSMRGRVTIALFQKIDGAWHELARAEDSGTSTPIIQGHTPVGIRTDFMDVEFDDVRVEKM